MTRGLKVLRAGPAMSIQDAGRTGFLNYGLSRGGAVDPLALLEGAALLGQDPKLAALEMASAGGTFEATEDIRIALTGAPMPAKIGEAAIPWNASCVLTKGSRLALGAAQRGIYGYLSVGGGLDAPDRLGAKGAHLSAGLGEYIATGGVLRVGTDKGSGVGKRASVEPRLDGGTIRIVKSLQTHLFSKSEIKRFEATAFRRDSRFNRMGTRLSFEDTGFALDTGLRILSEVIVPGDIQITGDGTPFVLLNECQTVGGYPRIGTVIPPDLPRVAQAAPGTGLRFKFVSLAEAVEAVGQDAALRASIASRISALVRAPHDIPDLLAYQLISGATTGATELV